MVYRPIWTFALSRAGASFPVRSFPALQPALSRDAKDNPPSAGQEPSASCLLDSQGTARLLNYTFKARALGKLDPSHLGKGSFAIAMKRRWLGTVTPGLCGSAASAGGLWS